MAVSTLDAAKANSPSSLYFTYGIPLLHTELYFGCVLNECESWSLTQREESRPRVFEKRVLRRILWPKKDEVEGEWEKQYKEKTDALYFLPNIIREINKGD